MGKDLGKRRGQWLWRLSASFTLAVFLPFAKQLHRKSNQTAEPNLWTDNEQGISSMNLRWDRPPAGTKPAGGKRRKRRCLRAGEPLDRPTGFPWKAPRARSGAGLGAWRGPGGLGVLGRPRPPGLSPGQPRTARA